MNADDKFNKEEFKKGMKPEKRRKDKESFKVRDGVFDKSTLMTLYGLIKSEKLQSIEGIVSTGKEANVFWGYDTGNKEVAIKIYRVTTSNFKTMWQYLVNDPRFKNIKRHQRQVVFAWGKREFKNLKKLERHIPVPSPSVIRNNVLVMDFLGKKGIPYPQLKERGPKNEKKDFNAIIKHIKIMYENGIVHADLSEYNILCGPKKLYLIDFSQGTVATNPLSKEFLKRDVENIIRYFSKFIEVPDMDEILGSINGETI
ncbi:MAG: serine protein kinase RIO [Candidatus Methanofastidiosia archaeon]